VRVWFRHKTFQYFGFGLIVFGIASAITGNFITGMWMVIIAGIWLVMCAKRST